MITYASYTDVGDREKNEDSIASLCDSNSGLFVLADGLGGHGKGEFASASVITTSMQLYSDNKAGFSLDRSFEKAQEILLREQQERNDLEGMKTTMVSLLIRNGAAKWAHIGDSRLYYFKKKKLVTRTLDHSVPQMLVAMGEIKEKDIRGHEDRNRLLRVMGSPWSERSYSVSNDIRLSKDSAFLLCSDGFWENIIEDDMMGCLRTASDVSLWLQMMAQIVKHNGRGKNMDNNSAIAVWFEKD
ncbi:MAG: serine/threonine-protein phosphatase [Eubacterium sp.]|nr:serine/threonine-protein phosphatase [Eubacterium sp.]